MPLKKAPKTLDEALKLIKLYEDAFFYLASGTVDHDFGGEAEFVVEYTEPEKVAQQIIDVATEGIDPEDPDYTDDPEDED